MHVPDMFWTCAVWIFPRETGCKEIQFGTNVFSRITKPSPLFSSNQNIAQKYLTFGLFRLENCGWLGKLCALTACQFSVIFSQVLQSPALDWSSSATLQWREALCFGLKKEKNPCMSFSVLEVDFSLLTVVEERALCIFRCIRTRFDACVSKQQVFVRAVAKRIWRFFALFDYNFLFVTLVCVCCQTKSVCPE